MQYILKCPHELVCLRMLRHRRALSSTATITLTEAKQQLGLDRTSGVMTTVKVKAAFRKRAFELHPDTSTAAKGSKSSDDAFKHLQTCYVLALRYSVDEHDNDKKFGSTSSSRGSSHWDESSSSMTVEQLNELQERRKREAWREFMANPEVFAAGYAKAHAHDEAMRAQFEAEGHARAAYDDEERRQRAAANDLKQSQKPPYKVGLEILSHFLIHEFYGKHVRSIWSFFFFFFFSVFPLLVPFVSHLPD